MPVRVSFLIICFHFEFSLLFLLHTNTFKLIFQKTKEKNNVKMMYFRAIKIDRLEFLFVFFLTKSKLTKTLYIKNSII